MLGPWQEVCSLPTLREVPEGALLQPCMPVAGMGGAQAVLPGSRYLTVLFKYISPVPSVAVGLCMP